MAKRVPVCQVCGNQHYNFESCAEFRSRVRAVEARKVQPVFRDHSRMWGNRSYSVDVVSDGSSGPVIVSRKKGQV